MVGGNPFRDAKQTSSLGACQCRIDQARHVAFVLLTFTVLQVLRLGPEETLGQVKERLQQGMLKVVGFPQSLLEVRWPIFNC